MTDPGKVALSTMEQLQRVITEIRQGLEDEGLVTVIVRAGLMRPRLLKQLKATFETEGGMLPKKFFVGPGHIDNATPKKKGFRIGDQVKWKAWENCKGHGLITASRLGRDGNAIYSISLVEPLRFCYLEHPVEGEKIYTIEAREKDLEAAGGKRMKRKLDKVLVRTYGDFVAAGSMIQAIRFQKSKKKKAEFLGSILTYVGLALDNLSIVADSLKGRREKKHDRMV